MHSSSRSAAEGPSHPGDSHDVSEPTPPDERGGFSLRDTMRETLRQLALELSSVCTAVHHPLGWKTRALLLGPLESTSRTCIQLEQVPPPPFKTQWALG